MKVLHHQLVVLVVLAVLAAAVTAVVLAANFSIVIKRHQSVPFLLLLLST
ncbi:Adenylate cyclase [Vibrio chagasii]|nr:Adenylate cyclase [Vibrio chagasii]